MRIESFDNADLRGLLRPLVIGSFVVELLLAEGWLRFGRGDSIAGLLLRPGPETSLAAGLVLAAIVALLSRLFFSRIAGEITRELFVPIFRSATRGDVVLLALLPGLGEEILFRGTIQPELGLVATSLIFGLLHSGLSRALLPYGLWAAAVGASLGTLYLATGNLWGCIAAHTLTNAAGILWVKRLV